MREIISKYKEQIKYFITNKKYIIPVIFVAILSYGFTITHYSIGVDDICFDRYVTGTYILSAKRWGTWLLYNLLKITEFSPFWLDFIVATFMVILAIVLCSFFRRQFGDKIKIWTYVVFSSLLISYPLINQFFIYQSTNLAVVVSNLLAIICGIIIYENYFEKNKKSIYIISGIGIGIALSMYESCAQSYLVFLFIATFLLISKNNKFDKNTLKYFIINIILLIMGMVIYFITGNIVIKILEAMQIVQKDFAFKGIIWTKEIFWNFTLSEKLHVIYSRIIQKIASDINTYLPITIFAVLSLIGILLEIVKLIKTSKVSRMVMFLGIIFTNFILIILQFKVLYRIQFSWVLTSAFLGMYIYQTLCDKKILKYVINIIAILLIVIQTRTLNQYFYNDYKRYEKEKLIANDIALEVVKNCDYKNKPLVYITRKTGDEKGKENEFLINNDNGKSVIEWGMEAFCEYEIETTDFINELGYNFLYTSKEQIQSTVEKYNNLDEETKKQTIIELDDCIIVDLDKYYLF